VGWDFFLRRGWVDDLTLVSLMLLYVTPVTLPVAPETVLMRTPLSELTICESRMLTVSTVLSLLPPTLPMLKPWPPEQ